MRFALFILLSGLISNAAPMGFMQPRIGGTNLVVWWTFNIVAGTNVVDYSGRANHGYLGAYGLGTGKVPAIAGMGVTNYAVSYANVSHGIGTGDYTISVWARPDTAGWAGYVGGMGIGNRAPGFYLRINSTPTGVRDSAINYLSDQILTLDVWNHVVFRRISGVVSYALNGVVSTQTNTVTTSIDNVEFAAGASNYAGGDWKAGAFDDARLYNRALTDAEIKQLYNGGRATQQ